MQYISPKSVEEATQYLQTAPDNAVILNGGSDVLVRLRTDMIAPDSIINIKNIDELRHIRDEDGGIRIGASVTCAEMQEDERLASLWPGVVEGAGLIGSTQVQGRATIAGNLCNASPAADSVPALVAAGATARLASADGVRDVAVKDIPIAPGKTSLKKGEFVTSIFLPPRPKMAGDAYLRFIPRTEMDIAVVGTGAYLTLNDDGSIAHAQLALSAVAPTVILLDGVNDILQNTNLDEGDLNKLKQCVMGQCTPISDKRGTKEFRTDVAGVLAVRAAKQAFLRAKNS